MQDSTIVSVAVIAAGTAVGVVDLWLNHDGVILSAMLGLYGIVLGYVFGKNQQTAVAAKTS